MGNDAGPPNNRRLIGRAGIERGALLFFKGQPGARGATSLTSRTVAQNFTNLSVLPNTFELTFDNFWTIRMSCVSSATRFRQRLSACRPQCIRMPVQ
jgi:hypothetical protein